MADGVQAVVVQIRGAQLQLLRAARVHLPDHLELYQIFLVD